MFNPVKDFYNKIKQIRKSKWDQMKNFWSGKLTKKKPATGGFVTEEVLKEDAKKQKIDDAFKSAKERKFEEGPGGIIRRRAGIGIGKIIGLAIFGIIIIGAVTFFFSNALFQSIFGFAIAPFHSLLGQPVGGVPLKDTGTYLGCLLEKSFSYVIPSPSTLNTISSSGVTDFFELCKQDLVGAQEIGCSECFEISVEPLNPRVFAGTGQKAIFSARVSAQDKEFCYNDLFGERTCQPLTPAAGGKISIDAGENVKADLQSNLNLCEAGTSSVTCDEIDPAIISVTPLTVVGSVGADQLCGGKTNAIEARATLEYIYRTEGSAPIYIQKAKIGETKQANLNARDPITLPGPVKVDIIPDAYLTGNTYNPLLTNNFFVFVKFRNVGEGGAEVQRLELKQIAPEKTSPLGFKGCSGPIDDKGQEADGVITVVPEKDTFTLSPTERSGTILCEFAIPADLKGELSTYIITGAAIYNYTLQRESSSVIIDQTRCGKEAEAPAATTGTGGGITQVEVLK